MNLSTMPPSSKLSREPPARQLAPLYALSAAVTISLLILFYNIRISLKPFRFDAEQKDDERGRGLEIWEVLLCLCVPLLTWRYKWSLSRLMQRCCLQRKASSLVFLFMAVLCIILILRRIFVRPSLCSHKGDSWMLTDVGYIRTHPNTRATGVSMRTLCDGRIWEPHVAQSIEAHLFGQGRAIDVGAFVGYHTVRLAKAAAPFDVYAFEGRPPSDLNDNIMRNNAVNVHVVQETVDENWKLSAQLEQDLLNEQDKGPLALIKIDCEGCELHFLKGAKTVLQKYHPVMIIEIQDDATRRNAKLGGQRMIQPTETRKDVLDYLTDELGYVVESLRDEDGGETWDYLAYRL
mmetsp:Transcript_6580/g.9697  ORF Transcript_6580/g.9697 Transcript_6580/m.9697 type:complete len:348 (-) Transcript_6580:256-1299(-)